MQLVDKEKVRTVLSYNEWYEIQFFTNSKKARLLYQYNTIADNRHVQCTLYIPDRCDLCIPVCTIIMENQQFVGVMCHVTGYNYMRL